MHGYNADCFSQFLINETRLPKIFRNSFWATKICGSEILEVSESRICYHVTATPEKTERSKFENYSESYLLLRIFQYLDLKGISRIHLPDKKTPNRRGKRAPLSDKEQAYVKSELLFHKNCEMPLRPSRVFLVRIFKKRDIQKARKPLIPLVCTQ